VTKIRLKTRSLIEDEKEVPKKDGGKDADNEDKEEKVPFREAIGYVPARKPEIKNNQEARARTDVREKLWKREYLSDKMTKERAR